MIGEMILVDKRGEVCFAIAGLSESFFPVEWRIHSRLMKLKIILPHILKPTAVTNQSTPSNPLREC
jgi:hypothetical protein